MRSTVLLIPADLQADGNAVAEQMGWGPSNYSIAVTPDGKTISHYGLHAFTSAQFRGWVEGTEPLPEGMEHAQAVIAALVYSFRDDIKNRQHFEAVLAANGLQPMPLEAIEP